MQGPHRDQKPKKKKQFLSTLVILAGCLLVLLGGSVFLARYPWQLALVRWGWAATPEDLPDPAPLPVELLGPGSEQPGTVDWGLEKLMEKVEDSAARPTVYMTQMGTVKLPKIGVSENIVEGAGDELLYAVGHVRGSAGLGQEGNCVLAGHRNYIHMNPFRHLDKLAEGDRVLVEDGEYRYTYEVFSVFEVEPEEQWVMENQEETYLLTLITCTPVVNPTKRLVVWCRLADTSATT